MLAEHGDPNYDCEEHVDDDDGKKAKKPKTPKLDKHPVMGFWLVESSPQDRANSLELIIFGPGGSVMNIGDDLNWAGSWTPTGKCTIDATFQSLANDPEAGFLGLTMVRTSVEVTEDGESFAGTFTVELPAAVSEAMGVPAGQLGPGEVTGQRVSVEPMGETVGPWPPAPPSEEAEITQEALIGTWRAVEPRSFAHFYEDGTYRISFSPDYIENTAVEQGRFTLEGSLFTFISSEDSRNCGTGERGSYEIEVLEDGPSGEDRLKQIRVEDECAIRGSEGDVTLERVS